MGLAAISDEHRVLMNTVMERISSGESGPPPLPIPTEGTGASVREDNPGEESSILSPRGRKRTTPEDSETKVSKREKKSPPEGPASEGALAAQSPCGDQPSNEL